MPTIALTTQQIIGYIQQMSPEERFKALRVLARSTPEGRELQMKHSESSIRQECAQRGLDWDAMDDEERLDFINDIIHEDRACTPYRRDLPVLMSSQ